MNQRSKSQPHLVAKSHPGNSPIAVVGVSALFPGSVNETGFWRDILAGKDLVEDIPDNHWLVDDYYDPDPQAPDKTYCKRGAFLPPVDFDPLAWGVPPSIVPATDTTQLLALIVAKRVLDDATRGQFEALNKERVSVILGITSAQELLGSMVSRLQHPIWAKSLREMGLSESKVQDACKRIASHYVEWQESTFPGVLGNVVAGRIANRLDLGGTNCVTDAACASSFSAISMAVNELRLGQSDMVIAGGADTMNDIFMYMCFSKTPALSKSGDCRPFSDQADGTLLGEGIGMVALKRLADAEAEGDRIYAVLKGLGSSSDGRANSVYAPLASGQAKALRRAYEQAGYDASSVGLLEAHGTGTVAGDAAEFSGLSMVFSTEEQKSYCALGSVKSQIGHTKAAAGAAGLFKAVMALHHKVLPPSIKIDRPNPKLDLDTSAFYLNTVARPWIQAPGTPRRASVSAFGFGGSNFHITLEEYKDERSAPRLDVLPDELLALQANSIEALQAQCAELAQSADQAGMLETLARASQDAWDASSHDAEFRLLIVASSEAELISKLNQAIKLIEPGTDFSTPDGIDFGQGKAQGKLGFLFAGQGSQYLFMGSDLAQYQPVARAAWDRAAGLSLGRDEQLHDVVFPAHAFEQTEKDAQHARLTETNWAQPAIGATSLMQLSLLRKLGVQPDAVAGHSFGELTALHAAGVISESELLKAAAKRGVLMKAAASVAGAMLAVTAPIESVGTHIASAQAQVTIANHNGPNQVVLSGEVSEIEAVQKSLNHAGISTRRLNVTTAFHSPLVSETCAPFHSFLEGTNFSPPQTEVYSGTTGKPYPDDAQTSRSLLSNQIKEPIRFVSLVENMYEAGVRTFVEVGPGSVLTNLVGSILEGRSHRVIPLDRKGRNGISTLQRGLARLAAAGLSINLALLWEARRRPLDPRTQAKSKLLLSIDGTSYGKPYPPPEGAAALPKPNPEPTPQNGTGAQHHVAPQEPAHAQIGTAPQAALGNPGWVQVYQEMQRQTVEAHTTYQRAMAESHAQFLRTAEASFSSLSVMLGGAPIVSQPPAHNHLASPAAVVSQPTFAPIPAHAPVAPAPAPAPPIVTTATPSPARAPTYTVPAVPHASPPQVPSLNYTAQPTAAMPQAPQTPTPKIGAEALNPAATEDLGALLIATVAAKTGYPEEMLGLEMDLEADLGVDSIKRVEILAAMSQQAPHLPELDPAELGGLRTLGQIVDYLQRDTKGPEKSNGELEKKAPSGVRI